MRLGSCAAAFAVLCTTWCGVACADSIDPWLGKTIDVKLTGVGPGQTVKLYYNGDTMNAGAGIYNWVPATGSDNKWPFDRAFQTFCIDIAQAVDPTSTFLIKRLEESPVTKVPGANNPAPGTSMSFQQAEWLRELWGEHFHDLQTGTTTQQRRKATGFQLAIWEILFETSTYYSPSLASGKGNLYVKSDTSDYSAIVSQANAYLASTFDNVTTGYADNLVALTNKYGQDHLAVVPLPPAVAGGLLLLGVVGARRRRQHVGT